MGNYDVLVSYEDFVAMLDAKIRIDVISKMVESGDENCSSSVKVLLGIKEKSECQNTFAEFVDATATPGS